MSYSKCTLFVFSLFFIALISCHAQLENKSKKALLSSNDDRDRYLENINSSMVGSWAQKQDSITHAVLSRISNYDYLDSIAQDVVYEFDGEAYFSVTPTPKGNCFFKKVVSYDESAGLYYREEGSDEDILLFKPASIDSNAYINYFRPSWDDTKVVIGLSFDDKEFSDFYVYDLINKKLLSGKVGNGFPNALGGPEWLPDNTGFFYTYIPVTETTAKDYLKNSAIHLHRLVGTDGIDMEPIVVFSAQMYPELGIDPTEFPIAYIHSAQNNHLTIEIATSDAYRDTYISRIQNFIDLSSTSRSELSLLVDKNDNIQDLRIDGDHLYFLKTGKNSIALCKTSIEDPNFSEPNILFRAESPRSIEDYIILNDHIVLIEKLNGVQASLYSISKSDENTKKLDFPLRAGNLSLKSSGQNANDLRINASGWTFYDKRFRYDYEKNSFLWDKFDNNTSNELVDGIVIEEVEVPSYDGTLVPLSVIYKEGTELNGHNHLLLHVYGAYGNSVEPYLSYELEAWLKLGGIYAVAHVRGGGEKGPQWHEAGKIETKPNTWLDVIACGQYLVEEKYSSPNLLSLKGVSAGGIAVSRAIIEQPDLFAAVYISSGILNPYRAGQIGTRKGNENEYGDYNNEKERPHLKKMDAFEQLKEGVNYPAVLCKVGMNDARVPPWQSFKFFSKLQNYSTNNSNFILVNVDRGHDKARSSESSITDIKNAFAFLLWQTGHPDFQPLE